MPAVATWDDARAAAESFTLKGVRGHLATITSAEESDFLNRNFHLESLWIGASDAAIEGEWRWVVGPEAGELFWLGAADGQALGYANWGGNEPNGFTPDEDYAEFNSLTTAVQGTWNDYTSVQDPNRFLVEFSVVPEPSSYALLTIGGAALAIYARQRRRRT
ncbi:MAG: lectin-like protein [Planctomycetia bacterium]|nr:lectin-like protein [Planctomycetia bacterium]